jgi:hypothetical protein
MPDGIAEPVTTFTYVTFKIKLYQIASPIVADIYFHRGADLDSLATKVMSIDKQLRNWFASLPPELKLEELCHKGMKDLPKNARLFMLQALALQLAYDNVQILLHRPSLSKNIKAWSLYPTERRPFPGTQTCHLRVLRIKSRLYFLQADIIAGNPPYNPQTWAFVANVSNMPVKHTQLHS